MLNLHARRRVEGVANEIQRLTMAGDFNALRHIGDAARQ
jgi:hypothetical protein